MKLNKLRKKMNQKGFTLIELIIVIAILGILAALAIPRFLNFTDDAQVAADEDFCALVKQAAAITLAEGDVASDVIVGVANLSANAGVGSYDFQSDLYSGDETGIVIDATGGDIVVEALNAAGDDTIACPQP